ncbi:hypothetical protein [Microvirga zambiensis]|uniref:hypothetical protein n=1 Tax=Microvirga zambiensis TaxID=1402137 RepID=UPI00191E280D|nr:hypothetical protein [Microvirga zambiensis]
MSRTLAFDEIETALAVIDTQLKKTTGSFENKPAPTRSQVDFDAHAEGIEVIIEPVISAACEGPK